MVARSSLHCYTSPQLSASPTGQARKLDISDLKLCLHVRYACGVFDKGPLLRKTFPPTKTIGWTARHANYSRILPPCATLRSAIGGFLLPAPIAEPAGEIYMFSPMQASISRS